MSLQQKLPSGIRAALLHDWLTGFRGGERVLESFCTTFPKAPLYTLLHVKGSVPSTIENREIHTSFLNVIPGIGSKYRMFLPLMPAAADAMSIDSADLVLSSSHCVIKGVKKPKGSAHVCYLHSPMRYMYDQYDHYFGASASLPVRLGGRLFRPYLVKWDRESNRNVDLMIANSAFVRERVRKFYGIDCDVVHPFVELSDFAEFKNKPAVKDDFYVMVTAFAPNKRVDLAIETFNRLRKPLKIIGSGQQETWLKTLAGPTIEFLGSLSRKEVIDSLSRARALIFPGVEDFGIVPLESLAAGTPVIAFREGGVLETLTREDAVFFGEPTPGSLSMAIEEFERDGRKVDFTRLEKFSRDRFQANMIDRINLTLEKRG